MLARMAIEAGAYEWAAAYLEEVGPLTYNQAEREAFARAYLGAVGEIQGQLAAIAANSEFDALDNNRLRIQLRADVQTVILNGFLRAEIQLLERDPNDDAKVFFYTLRGRFFKIEYDLWREEGALTAAKEEFEKAWPLAKTLSPVNPAVWDLAVVNAEVLRLANAPGEAAALLDATIDAAFDSEEDFDERVPEF